MRSIVLLPLTLSLSLLACRSAVPQYIVTSTPLATGVTNLRLCVAVDPADAQGIWWWEPGRSGCASRSTGPEVFHADQATVAAASSGGAIDLRFRLQMHFGPPRDIALVLENGEMREATSGERVSTRRRSDLRIPEGP